MKYVSIVKPGIILGNAITVIGSFFLGSRSHLDLLVLIAAIIGMSLVMACGCVLNNIIDRDIDALMQRTKNRVMVKGLITLPTAYSYAGFLGASGLAILYFLANPLAAGIALFGLFIYVVVYSLYAKRESRSGTLVGAIAGAIPPVVGYCAATHTFNSGAIIVFLLLFFWQIPHSNAIAIFRLQDYSNANIPVLPVRKSLLCTKINMLIFVVLFAIASIMPSLFGYLGKSYLIVAACIGAAWLYLSIKGFTTKNVQLWSRRMFTVSILNITVLSTLMAVT